MTSVLSDHLTIEACGITNQEKPLWCGLRAQEKQYILIFGRIEELTNIVIILAEWPRRNYKK